MIPKNLHFIWLGNENMKEEHVEYILQFKEMYLDYNIHIWNDHDVKLNDFIPDNLKKYYFDNNFSQAFKSDILRYIILYKYGGLYFDVDFQPLNKIQDPFLSFDFLGAIQNNGEVNIAFIGSSKNNKIIKQAIDSIPSSIKTAKDNNYYYNDAIYKITGPEFFNNITNQFRNDQDSFFFTKEYFYPYWFEEKHRKSEDFKKTSVLSYAVHHWATSWRS